MQKIQRYLTKNLRKIEDGYIFAWESSDEIVCKWFEIDPIINKLELENERLEELVKDKDELLVCYRIGKRPSERLIDKLNRLRNP